MVLSPQRLNTLITNCEAGLNITNPRRAEEKEHGEKQEWKVVGRRNWDEILYGQSCKHNLHTTLNQQNKSAYRLLNSVKPTTAKPSKRQRSFRKHFLSATATMTRPKPLSHNAPKCNDSSSLLFPPRWSACFTAPTHGWLGQLLMWLLFFWSLVSAFMPTHTQWCFLWFNHYPPSHLNISSSSLYSRILQVKPVRTGLQHISMA